MYVYIDTKTVRGETNMGRRYDVLLADASEEYRILMKEIIESSGEFRLVAHMGSGAEALELTRQLRPDVVVTDAILSDMTGFALLDTLEGIVPERAMVTAHCQTPILLEVIRRQIRLFLPKPFREDALLEMLRRACNAAEEYRVSAQWEARVTRELHMVGVPAHIKGYLYVRRAILMVMAEPELAHSLTKELYPALARQFSTTPSCVERAIRSAVDAAWLRGDPELQRAYFNVDKPSNGVFIAAMAEKLRRERESSAA
jgi:two-component system response regulator (stage 0 sporulation protein A)